MAIKNNRTNPLIVLECVVVGIERDARADEETGVINDKGRKLTVQTAQGPELEVKVALAFDILDFEIGVPVLINAEYLEWDFDGRRGSTMRFHSFVGLNQLDRWHGIVKAQAQAKAVPA